MIDWTKLYVDLLQNGSPAIIVQTLNRIILHGKTRKDKTNTNIASNIFANIYQVLSLQYRTIDTFLKGPRPKFLKSTVGKSHDIKMENTKMIKMDGFLNKGRMRLTMPSPMNLILREDTRSLWHSS